MLASLQNLDADDVFGYVTQRHVKIRDRRLGLLNWALRLVALAYVIAYNVVYRQLYLKTGDVIGSATLSLLPGPSSSGSGAPAYCSGSNSSWSRDGSGPDSAGPRPQQQLPCRYLDALDVVFPAGEDSAIFVATRVTQSNQTLPPGCAGQLVPGCAYSTISNSSYYIASIEDSLLALNSVMTAPSLGITGASNKMCGTLQDEAGEEYDPCDDFPPHACPQSVAPAAGGKTGSLGALIPLRSLLRAAGIPSLDAAGIVDAAGAVQSYRSVGVVLLLSVEFSNFAADTGSWTESKLTYRLVASAVSTDGYSAAEVVSSNSGSVTGTGSDMSLGRLVLERSGVRVVVRQSGTIGRFDTAQLLLTLTTSLSLIAVAKLVVDYMASHVLPLRHIYRQYITIKTVDFSDLELLEAQMAEEGGGTGHSLLERFKHSDLINPAPAIFGTMDLHGHLLPLHVGAAADRVKLPSAAAASAVAALTLNSGSSANSRKSSTAYSRKGSAIAVPASDSDNGSDPLLSRH